MTRIRFEDLPSTNTPRNAENLNKLNNVVISPTEPTTGEEVWIDNTNKNLYTKNDNGDYEEFYNEKYVKGTILWENSNTHASFEEQTITLNSTDYDRLEWYFKLAINSNYVTKTETEGDYDGVISYSDGYEGSIRTRTIIKQSSTVYKISKCYYYTDKMTTDSTLLIPIKVVGYKNN